MALSIDSIRNFSGSGSITLAQQGSSVEKSALQRFRSFFNIGDARLKNAETLTAIHHAVLNDPRFAAPDIQSEAARLLSQVRTDRAIGAAQIKGIIQTLDSLTLNTADAVKSRVTARLAATMPAWAAGHESELLAVVQDHVLRGVQNGQYANVDVAGRMQEIMGRLTVAFTHAGDDPDLKEILFSTLESTISGQLGAFASDQKIQQRVDAFRDDLAHVNARAQQSSDPATVKRLGIEMLKGPLGLGKPVNAGVVDALDAFALTLPYKGLGRLGPKSSASDILCAVHRLAETIRTGTIAYAPGVTPLNGGDEIIPAQKYLVKRVLAELPASVQKSLLAAFESVEGRNACAYIASRAASGAAVGDYNAVAYACEFLRPPDAKPSSGIPGENDRPSIVNMSPLARCAFEPEHAIGGSASAPLRAAILKPHNFGSSIFPAEGLHAKIDSAAQSMLTGTFAVEMKKFATGAATPQFDKDIVRGMKITLPDGTRVSTDVAKARDQFARLVTGDGTASYASLGAADKAKANAFMALFSQETEKAVTFGIPMGLSSTGSTTRFNPVNFRVGDGPQPERAFTISGTPSEGFSIHYQGSFPTQLMLYEDAHGQMQQTPVGQKIVCNYEFEAHVPSASLNQVAQTDWSQYDPSASDAVLAERDHPNRLADSLNAIPQAYRLDMDVTAGFSIQADAAPAPAAR